jgi:putative flippase GtrA
LRSVDGIVRYAQNAETTADDLKKVNEMQDAGRAPVVRGHGWVERILSRTPRRHHPAPQLARFLVVGAGNTVLSFVVYRLLLALGAWYVLAAPLAFAVGAVNGYVFNRRWTFGARDTTRARVLYVAVQVVGALSTSLLVLLFVRAAGTGRVSAYLAAVPLVTLGMFAANRLWTFAERN